MKLFEDYTQIAIIGKPKSGKSYLTKYLISEALKKKNFGHGIVLCGANNNEYYSDFLPEKYIFNDNFSSIIQRFMQHRLESKHKLKSFIVFDDVIGLLENDENLKQLISRYRHFNCSIIICIQHANGISTQFKEFIERAFVFKQTTLRAVNMLYEWMGQDFENIRAFREHMNQYNNEKYSCMLFDSLADDENKFMTYKCPIYKLTDKYNF